MWRISVFLVAVAALSGSLGAAAGAIVVDYPQDGSIFPPDFASPTFIWRDPSAAATSWRIEVTFQGAPPLVATSTGPPPAIGEMDPRAVSDTNQPPALTPEQAASHTWAPDPEMWEAIKRNSVKRPATVTIRGLAGESGEAVSQGVITIRTSTDPVGAPIFYRDVPLMPSETEKGIIKPLARAAIPLIAWRLRDVSQPRSRLLLEKMHTCANCHSFSRDGKTLGMDLDGPRNDKGMYALASIEPRMQIRNEDVVSWTSFLGKPKNDLRIGFMSQVSPDGEHVVTMINGWNHDEPNAPPPPAAQPANGRTNSPKEIVSNFFVTNFKDYRFLQVFYPTAGILAWYSRADKLLQPLPGADDPRYVHTGATWSPDGSYLVFSRTEARDAYEPGAEFPLRANDPGETQIQYDLYRIPFNDGNGGRAEPIRGASANGMSNSFPKVSPDGRWIVFVQARNGQLMRPDSELYIVPAKGGKARRMRCNTPLMNSWHSFSPNGRWLVFSSKARSPYTQMYLTHIDKDGQDSPPILIENSTAANRAVNIPEFVNVPPEGLVKIDVPAVEFYRVFDEAWELAGKGRYEEAIPVWRKALELNPADPKVLMNLGVSLARTGQTDGALESYRQALAGDPGNSEVHMNLGITLAETGRLDDAIGHYQRALELNPEYPEAHSNLGAALAASGKMDEAVSHYRQALELKPDYSEVHSNLGVALARAGKLDDAVPHFERAAELAPESPQVYHNLVRALASAGRTGEAIDRLRGIAAAHPDSAEAQNSLGVALVLARRADEAIDSFERALKLKPDFTEARQNLGDTLFYLQGRAGEAIDQWRQVVRANPGQVAVLNQLARVLATYHDQSLRNGAEAVGLAERAAQATGNSDPVILDTLAAAYAEAGCFAEAIETARLALPLAGSTPLAESLKSRIALYEEGKALRLSPQR